jgi:hypothetical protein
MNKRALRFLLPVALAAGVLLSLPAQAQTYNLIGSGTGSCGTWSADRRQPPPVAFQDEQWVLGFLSGIGFVGDGGDNPLNGVDAAAVWGWMDNYCQAHPLESIATAAKNFYQVHPHG